MTPLDEREVPRDPLARVSGPGPEASNTCLPEAKPAEERVSPPAVASTRRGLLPLWVRLFYAGLALAGLLSAVIRQPSANVRIRIEASGARFTVAANDQIQLAVPGESVLLSGVSVQRPPPELVHVLAPTETGDLSLETDSMGKFAVQRFRLLRDELISFKAERDHVEVRVQCPTSCSDRGFQLVANGAVKSERHAVVVAAPTAIEFVRTGGQTSIVIERQDTLPGRLANELVVSAVSFVEQRLENDGTSEAVGEVSAVRGGLIKLPSYPSRNWAVTAGDEVKVSGQQLRLISVEQSPGSLMFDLAGDATILSLGRENLLPSWWDRLRTGDLWPLLVLIVTGPGAYMAFIRFASGRSE